jgi:hypothetical protein
MSLFATQNAEHVRQWPQQSQRAFVKILMSGAARSSWSFVDRMLLCSDDCFTQEFEEEVNHDDLGQATSDRNRSHSPLFYWHFLGGIKTASPHVEFRPGNRRGGRD